MTPPDLARVLASVDHDRVSPDDDVRRLAVERMSELPADEAVPRLAASLGDDSWRVRKSAVARLLALDPHVAVDRWLIEALADGEDPGRRNAAAQALVARGADAVPAVLAALDTSDVDVRKQLVDVLAGIGDDSAEPAIRRMLDDSDPNVAAAAADALGVIGGAASAADLVAAVRCDGADRLLRMSALRAIARLELVVEPDVLEPLLADRVLRPAALEALSTSDDPRTLELLLKGLVGGSRASRDAAVAGLVRIVGRGEPQQVASLVGRIRETVESHRELVDEIAAGVAGRDLASRLVQIQFLGLTGDRRVVLPLLDVCGDEAVAELAHATLAALGDVCEATLDEEWGGLTVDARRAACPVLSRTRGERGRVRLEQALDDPDAALRIAAVQALAGRADVAATGALVQRLVAMSGEGSGDVELEREDECASIVDALVAIASGAETTVPVIAALAERLDADCVSVRLALARILGRVASDRDGPLVERLLRDVDPEVRRAAVGALARRTGTGSGSQEALRLALADESVLVRCAAADALGMSGDVRTFTDLERLHGDRSARVRAAALRAMARLGGRHDECRAPTFDRIAAVALDEGVVAIAAAEALAELGGAEAVDLAARFLTSPAPEVVLAAVACFARHAASDRLADLVPSTGNPEWSVRAEAIRVLAQRGQVVAVPVILRRLEAEQDDFVRQTILSALARLEG